MVTGYIEETSNNCVTPQNTVLLGWECGDEGKTKNYYCIHFTRNLLCKPETDHYKEMSEKC